MVTNAFKQGFFLCLFGVAVDIATTIFYKKDKIALDKHIESIFNEKAKTIENSLIEYLYKFGILS